MAGRKLFVLVSSPRFSARTKHNETESCAKQETKMLVSKHVGHPPNVRTSKNENVCCGSHTSTVQSRGLTPPQKKNIAKQITSSAPKICTVDNTETNRALVPASSHIACQRYESGQQFSA